MNINANQIAIRARERINQRVRAATIGTFSSVIRMTPVDSGRAKGNWQPTIGSPATGEGMSSEAEMIATVPHQAGSVVYLTNNVPYIQKLEYGGYGDNSPSGKTSGGFSIQAPNGMVRISIARFEGLLNGTG